MNRRVGSVAEIRHRYAPRLGSPCRRQPLQALFPEFLPNRPDPTIPRSPGHYEEWIAACKGGGGATCNFDYAGPLAETVLLGNVAYRTGGFDWNAQTLETGNNNDAKALIQAAYRKGWEI